MLPAFAIAGYRGVVIFLLDSRGGVGAVLVGRLARHAARGRSMVRLGRRDVTRQRGFPQLYALSRRSRRHADADGGVGAVADG